MQRASQLLSTVAKVLTLRFKRDDLSFDRTTLAFGLVCTWLAGIGRYWDHPDPHILQTLGAGSVVYVFSLSLILWLLLLPLRLTGLSYPHLLTLITLTAPPALLYAIPVERFFVMSTAQSINAWFLAVVAVWRVAIYFRYLRVYLQASFGVVFVAGLLPLCGIVYALAILNLEKAVFEIMAGIDPAPATGGDSAYAIVWLLTFLSFYAAPVLLLSYFVLIAVRWHRHRKNTAASP